MLKKFFILFFLFFTLISGAFAATDNSDILAANILYIINGYIDYPKWSRPIFASVAFSQYDSQGHELRRFHISSYDCIDKYDNKGEYRYNDFTLGYGDVKDVILRDLDNHAQIIARYKFSNNVIYHYDNNPDPKKGILRYFGFHEKGPGHLISTSKIFDDGSIIRYDTAGNKIASLKMTNKKNIKEYDAKGNYIGYYRFFSLEEAFPSQAKKTSRATAANSNEFDTSAFIVPIIIVLANNDEIDDSNFADKIKNAGSVSQYNVHGEPTNSFSIFGSSVTQYNAAGKQIARYDISGSNISHYDAAGKLIGTFSIFGDSVSYYDSAGNLTDSFSLFDTNILHYNAYGQSTDWFSFFENTVTHYDSSGYYAGDFDFF